MKETLPASLEKKRFIIHPESLKAMKGVRDSFAELKKKYPYLSGLSFFGSRTKGTESEGSDFDLIVFYNSDKMRSSEKVDSHGHILNSLIRKSFLSDIDMDKVDISRKETMNEIDYFIKVADRALQGAYNPRHLLFWSRPLVTRFYLAIGDGLYENRRLILDKFKSMGHEGDKYFAMLMDVLGASERNNDREGKEYVPRYDRYPKFITEAEKYFTVKSSGSLPHFESAYLNTLAEKALKFKFFEGI